MRLRADAFDSAAVHRFWEQLPENEIQLAPGTWFGEQQRVFRVGFSHLPLVGLKEALLALSKAFDQVLA